MKIIVRRKCDGKTGTVKSALGTTEGFSYFVVVFDENIPSKKAKASHFEVIGITDNGSHWEKQQ